MVEKLAVKRESATRWRKRVILHPFVPLGNSGTVREGHGFDSPWRHFFWGLSWNLWWFVWHVNNPQHDSYYVGGVL